MAIGLIDKLSNFLISEEDVEVTDQQDKKSKKRENLSNYERKSHLQVHSPASLKFFVVNPVSYDDAERYASQLKSQMALLINFSGVNAVTQQRIVDFLNGVSFITASHYQRVADNMVLYTPFYAEISKELFSYSIPTYVKEKKY